MQLHLKELLDRLNVGNVVLYSLLLLFAVLLSLRVEGIISWSYGAIFFPLWLWNTLVIAGAVTGIVAWVWNKRRRQESEHLYHFKALILSTLLQLPIFLTELLVAINLDTRAHQWRAIFTLLYALPLIYTFPCIWSCFRKRMLDLELLGCSLLLQVIFLAIRLDKVVQWKWALVFIPTYLLLLAYLICVCIYTGYLILHHTHPSQTVSPQELQDSRVADILRVVCSLAVGACVIIFVALLVSKLDGAISSSYPTIFIPLFLTLLLLLMSTITRQPANPWWFGIQKTFSTFLLDICPILREYVNISVVPEENIVTTDNVRVRSKVKHKQREISVTIASDMYPEEDIFTPD